MPDHTVERWLQIPEWQDYYAVSDRGRVRSLDRVVQRRTGPMRVRGGLLTLNRRGPASHIWVRLRRPGVARNAYVHTLVLTTFVGPRPPGQEGRHKDDACSNNDLSNLCWGTRSENQQDAVRNGVNGRTRRQNCPREHALKAPNLVASKAKVGRRSCLACDRASSDEAYAVARGRPFDFRTAADEHYGRILASVA